MKYTVVWQPTAESMLADIWNNAPDRNAVAAAADRIDTLLERDPLGQGESRIDPFRIMFEPPLVVDYEVREPKRQVLVLRVRRTAR
jgi:plasmid stabilization system protein ParE